MKNVFSKKMTIFVAIALLFVIGQLTGLLVLRAFFLQEKMKDLMPLLQSITEGIADGTFKASTRDPFIIRVYDANGRPLNVVDKDEAAETIKWNAIQEIADRQGLDGYLTGYMPKILAGETVADMKQFGDLPSRSIIIGMPVKKGNSVTGAVFLLKPDSDYQAAINGFSLVFLSTLFVGTIVILLFLWLYMREMKRLEQTRRNYVANISHELKSPISSIKALTETLSDGMVKDDESKDRYYNIILNESNRLERLIRDMLELSRLQSADTALSKETIYSRKLMKNIGDKYSALSDEMGIHFELTEAAATMPDLLSNEQRILQLLTILIDNAMKFVREDGRIIVDASWNAREVTLSVRDNGIGIEKKSLPYVFDRFYKEDTSRNSSGSGLGLSIAREIVHGLNEKIEVTSELGKGTEFRFSVKRA